MEYVAHFKDEDVKYIELAQDRVLEQMLVMVFLCSFLEKN
jgi:hypothetical protein